MNPHFLPTLGLLLLPLASAITLSAEPTGRAAQLIAQLKMQKIPVEGPWFALTYRSTDALAPASLPARYQGVPHVAGSAIYCLETKDDFSAFHILQTDELWHFYAGDPLELLLLYPDGHGETVILGPDLLSGQHPQVIVPRGVWQGSRPIGAGADSYTLFGCTLGPGFEYADCAFGYRDELQQQYPHFAPQIAALTRGDHATRPTAEAKPAAPAPIPAPTVFTPAEVAAINAAPGIVLRELAGRVAAARTDDYSIALFDLAAGQGMPTSYNRVSEEVFLIASGAGEVTLDGKTTPVATGATVIIKPKVRHSIKASAGSALSFYAISVPAYSPEDYVLSPDR